MLINNIPLKLGKIYTVQIVLIAIFVFFTSFIYAHGDLTIRIEQKTEEITKFPNKAELYFERGFLLQQHEDYNLAIKDYNKAETLGYNNKLLHYRKAESYFLFENYITALKFTDRFFEIDSRDIKIYKLKAQILFKLEKHEEALKLYFYVIENAKDLRPYNIIEYCDIILAIDPNNFEKTIEVINLGLEKIGKNTLTLQLKKLEYLESLGQTDAIVNQYNYFILEYDRKEYWYYKKAKYLMTLNRVSEANINLQLGKFAITQLDIKFQNTQSIINLIYQINSLETIINTTKL